MLTPGHFNNVFQKKPFRAASRQLTLLAVPNQLGHPRLGFAIAKKCVKKACGRNTIKRVIREQFRLEQHQLPAIDIIVLGRGGLDALEREEIRSQLAPLWKKLQRRFDTSPSA